MGDAGGERPERRHALRLTPRAFGLSLLGDVAIDTRDQRDETGARIRARGRRQAEKDDRRDHRADADIREVLQDDLEPGPDDGREEDVPVLQRQRGEDDQQHVDTDGEARHAARARARRKRRPLQKEHHRHVDEGDRERRVRGHSLETATPEHDRGDDPVDGEDPEIAGPRGQLEDSAEEQEEREERRDTPEAHEVDPARALEAFLRQLAVESVWGDGRGFRRHPGILAPSGRMRLVRWRAGREA